MTRPLRASILGKTGALVSNQDEASESIDTWVDGCTSVYCTRLPKYRCSQRPYHWIDIAAPVCSDIDALRGLVPG